MPYGLPWSEEFICQLAEKELRDVYVSDQVRSRIAQLIRVLRETEDRNWTQAELGHRAGKKQNVISRLENPDGAQPSVQTLLEIAAAFDLPLWIDMPNWDEWFKLIESFPDSKTNRRAFDKDELAQRASAAKHGVTTGSIGHVFKLPGKEGENSTRSRSDVTFMAVA